MCSKAPPASSTLHPSLADISALIGKWLGKGQGFYPTVQPFSFSEELEFVAIPNKPVISYTQKTSDQGNSLHGEAGFIRAVADGLEFSITDTAGISSVYSGTYESSEDSLTIKFSSDSIIHTKSAKDVGFVQREIKINKKTLELVSSLSMAAVGVDNTPHLTSTLVKDTVGISLDAFNNLDLSNYLVIDVREPAEYEKGTIPGAVNHPMGKMISATADRHSDAFNDIQSGKDTIVFCAAGGRANIVAESFRKRGLKQFRALTVGYPAWLAEQQKK